MNELISTKAKRLRALFLDVDGVLTDGGFYLSAHGDESKRFHTHDGLGLKRLQQQGLIIAIISSRNSPAVSHRMQELHIQHVHQGVACKLSAYEQLLQTLKLDDQAVAYMGDDLPDLPVLMRVGLSIAPNNAIAAVKQTVNWVTDRNGGNGAVREACEFILATKQYDR